MKRVRFEYENPNASSVLLAGDFTDWGENARAMHRAKGGGAFVAIVLLAPGEYQYKFVVDGEWLEDPQAETATNRFGTRNSRLTVSVAERGRKAA